MRQGAGHAGVSLELEARNAVGPRKGVAHSGHAGVEWAGVLVAVAAAGLVGREGAGGATQGGLCKSFDARHAQRLAGPSMADLTDAGQHQQLAPLQADLPAESQAEVGLVQSPAALRECHVLNILLLKCLIPLALSALPP